MLVPPFNQRIIVSSLVADFPIDLRHIVVEPAVVHPQKNIGIEIVVVLQTIGITTDLRTALITIDTKGRDTHFHPWLRLVYRLIELLDKEIHIIAAPVVDIPDTITILPVLLGIRDILSLHGIGIEIVVHMDTVDIITGDDILGHLADIIAVLGQSGIQDKHIVIGETTHRLPHGDMIGSQLLGGLRLSTIGIDPRVQLHPALVTLGDHPLQRIPVRLRGLTLLTGQETAPGFEFALIEGIALRTHLEDDHIRTVLLQLVELIGQRLLHLLGAHPLKLSVDTLNPRTTHLSLLGERGER